MLVGVWFHETSDTKNTVHIKDTIISSASHILQTQYIYQEENETQIWHKHLHYTDAEQAEFIVQCASENQTTLQYNITDLGY